MKSFPEIPIIFELKILFFLYGVASRPISGTEMKKRTGLENLKQSRNGE
jgi:hypothetical protein